MGLVSQVDWVVEGYKYRHRLDWMDMRLKAMDVQYHDLRLNKSLAIVAELETLVDDSAAERAMAESSVDT